MIAISEALSWLLAGAVAWIVIHVLAHGARSLVRKLFGVKG